MLSLVLVICLAVGSLGMSTTTHRPHHSHGSHQHGTHPTHAPHINENFYFHIAGNLLAVRHNRDCYIYELNAQEQMDMTTSHGLHEIEKHIIDVIDMGVTGTTMTHDALTALNGKLASYCGKFPIMKIN